VFNFAHGALGMLCAYVYWDLRVNDSHTWPLLPKGPWPAPLALAFVLLASAMKLLGLSTPLTGVVLAAVLLVAPPAWMILRRRHGFPMIGRPAPTQAEPVDSVL